MSNNKTQFSSLLYIVLISSSMMAISSNNWLMTWAALEINMLSFIPMMNSSNKFQEMEAMLKYFLAQALGSSFLLFMSSAMWSMNNHQTFISILLLMSLIIKLGMAPCHWWFPSVMTSLSWWNCLILSSWQKLAPLTVMMFMMQSTSKSMLILSPLNALMGSVLGMNQTKLKSIMAFSSITHMGWMSSFMLTKSPLMSIVYLLIYVTMITPMFTMFNKFSSSNINTLLTNKSQILLLSTILLSLSGIPPMTGFIPKWLTISYLWYMPGTIILLIIGAMINTYFYLNIIFSMSINYNKTMNNSMIKMSYITMSLSLLTLPIIVMMFYAMTLFN